jgi:hypothetical protein
MGLLRSVRRYFRLRRLGNWFFWLRWTWLGLLRRFQVKRVWSLAVRFDVCVIDDDPL